MGAQVTAERKNLAIASSQDGHNNDYVVAESLWTGHVRLAFASKEVVRNQGGMSS